MSLAAPDPASVAEALGKELPVHRAAVQEEKHKVLDAADAALRAARQLVATLFGIAPSEHQDVGAELARRAA